MYRSIIVPVDGSARSHAALPVAAELARDSGATLDIVRVHLDERPDLDDDPSWDGMFREEEMRYLEALALAYGPVAKRQIGTALLDPPVVDSLVEFAESRVAPLFVVAGRGRTGLRRALLGSTCDGLVRHGSAPVLILRDRAPGEAPTGRWPGRPFARVVLPLDGTTYAEGGIAHALAVAEATGARLRLVRVVGPVVTSAVLGALTLHPLYDEATIVRNDIAQDYLRRIAERIAVSTPKVQVATEVSLATDSSTAIIESCRRAAADLVVIPTHGRGLSRLIAGAVGDRLLRDGPDAILFVKPVESRFPAGLSEATPVTLRRVDPALVRG